MDVNFEATEEECFPQQSHESVCTNSAVCANDFVTSKRLCHYHGSHTMKCKRK